MVTAGRPFHNRTATAGQRTTDRRRPQNAIFVISVIFLEYRLDNQHFSLYNNVTGMLSCVFICYFMYYCFLYYSLYYIGRVA